MRDTQMAGRHCYSPQMPPLGEGLTFIVFVAIWLAVTAAFIGFRPEHAMMAVLLCCLFFYNGATRRFVLALLPFAIFGISYDWMNLLPNYMVNDVDVGGLYGAEKSLFGFESGGSVVTPNEYFAAKTWPIADFMAGVFYLCWVPVPIAFGVWLYASGRRKVYLHFALVFLLVNLIGFVCYYIHPAAAPWYVALNGADAVAVPGTLGQTAGLGAFDAMTGWHVFEGLYSRNSNVFAAVPSLHSAYVLVAFVYAVKAKTPKWLCAALFVIALGIWMSAVYTSHHYVIDVLLGILTALAGVAIFEWLLMRVPVFKDFMGKYLSAISPDKNQ